MIDQLTQDQWLRQLFSSQEALNGGVLKRKINDVEHVVGCDTLVAEAHRHGFQVVQNGRNFVIFCNQMPIRKLA